MFGLPESFLGKQNSRRCCPLHSCSSSLFLVLPFLLLSLSLYRRAVTSVAVLILLIPLLPASSAEIWLFTDSSTGYGGSGSAASLSLDNMYCQRGRR